MRVYNDLGHEFLAHGMFEGWRKTISTVGEVSIGEAVEVRENSTSQHWHGATVIGVSEEGIKVHFSGLGSRYDEVIHPKTTRLRRKPPPSDRPLMHSGRLWPTHMLPSPMLEKRGQRRPAGHPAAFLKPRERELFDEEKRRQADARVSSAVVRIETNQLKAELLRSALDSVENIRIDRPWDADPLGLGARQLVAELADCWRERAETSRELHQTLSGLEERRRTGDIAEYFQASLDAWSSGMPDDSKQAKASLVSQQQFGDMQENRKHADQVLCTEVSSQTVVDASRRLRAQAGRASVNADPRRRVAVSTARAVQTMSRAVQPTKTPAGGLEECIESTTSSLQKLNTSKEAGLESLQPEGQQPDAEMEAQSSKNDDDKETQVPAEAHFVRCASTIDSPPHPPWGERTCRARTLRQDRQARQEIQRQELERHFPGMFEAPALPSPPEQSNGQRRGSATPRYGVLGLPFGCTAAGQVALTPRRWQLNNLQKSE
jgi:hypothetical protein